MFLIHRHVLNRSTRLYSDYCWI